METKLREKGESNYRIVEETKYNRDPIFYVERKTKCFFGLFTHWYQIGWEEKTFDKAFQYLESYIKINSFVPVKKYTYI